MCTHEGVNTISLCCKYSNRSHIGPSPFICSCAHKITNETECERKKGFDFAIWTQTQIHIRVLCTRLFVVCAFVDVSFVLSLYLCVCACKIHSPCVRMYWITIAETTYAKELRKPMAAAIEDQLIQKVHSMRRSILCVLQCMCIGEFIHGIM